MATLDETIAELAGVNLEIERAQTNREESAISWERILREKYEEIIGSFHTFLPILKAQVDLAAFYREKLNLYLPHTPRQSGWMLNTWTSAGSRIKRTKITKEVKKWWKSKPILIEEELEEVIPKTSYEVQINNYLFTFFEEDGNLTETSLKIDYDNYDLHNPIALIDRIISEYQKKQDGYKYHMSYITLHTAFINLPELVVLATKQFLEKISLSRTNAQACTEQFSGLEVPDLEAIKERLRRAAD